MITSSHIIYSWALAKKTQKNNAPEQLSNAKPAQRRTLAFVLGALFPDIPTYLFFIVMGLILGYSGETMWDDMYFNSGWNIPITLTHSLWLWPLLIVIGAYLKRNFLRWFSISALIHTIVDLCVHTDDAYKHFWPFSDLTFVSPISYYNPAEYGLYMSAFDSLVVLGLLTYLYTQYVGKWRVLIISIGILYTARLILEPVLILIYGT